MQVATPTLASLHTPSGAHWSADDQALLDILLMPEPAVVAVEGPTPLQDVEMQEMFTSSPPSPPPELLQVQSAAATKKETGKDSPKDKRSAIERRARHREVVKRAYHRNKVRDRRWC